MKPMVYIIHKRMVWFLCDDRKFKEYFIPQYFQLAERTPKGNCGMPSARSTTLYSEK